MLRALLLITLVGIIGFFLAPRPLVAPDWKTALNKAIAANDCAAAERIVEVLSVTGHEGEAAQTEAQLGSAKKCRFSELSAERIQSAESFGNIYKLNFIERIGLRSPAIRTIRLISSKESLSSNPVFKNAERRQRDIFRHCYDKLSPLVGGEPNETLLLYALKNPEIPVADVWRISYEQQALCIREFASVSLLMEASARSGEDFRKAENATRFASMNLFFAPELSSELNRLDSRLIARNPDAFVDDLATAGCGRDSVASRDLWSAIRCAENYQDRKFSDPAAIYYVARARRLGWRDIGVADSSARANLTAECAEAMIRLEADELGGSIDPRDFKSLRWPIGEGEACESAVE